MKFINSDQSIIHLKFTIKFQWFIYASDANTLTRRLIRECGNVGVPAIVTTRRRGIRRRWGIIPGTRGWHVCRRWIWLTITFGCNNTFPQWLESKYIWIEDKQSNLSYKLLLYNSCKSTDYYDTELCSLPLLLVCVSQKMCHRKQSLNTIQLE